MAASVEPLAHSFHDAPDLPADQLTTLLGGKGAGLVAMTRMGLPVPPGFTLTTAACRRYLDTGWDDALEEAVRRGIAELEHVTGRRLGDPAAPLLVSVRSGAAVSMPGMMDTVLDVGLTAGTAVALAQRHGQRFADDTVARAAAAGVSTDAAPVAQVVAAVRQVFESWSSDRAVHYRAVEGLDEHAGTAVTVQTMVFGNRDDDSGTGVAFTRDPATGQPGLMGDFLPRAQGEDVVAGTHATLPLVSLRDRWPELWRQLEDVAARLEHHFADMVDLEFTVESGRLWLLQARRGKRSPLAVLRTAVDMAEDDDFPVDRAEAVRRCSALLDNPPASPGDVRIDERALVATGIPASPGLASGAVVLDADDAAARAATGERVVLVRRATSPADVHGISACIGLVTLVGGLVSHAAVVARSWGIPCVVGASALEISGDEVRGPGGVVRVGDIVTVDGTAGRVYRGAHTMAATAPPEVAVLRGWAREIPSDRPVPTGVMLDGVDPVFAVLHALAVRSMAGVTRLSAMLGMADAELTVLLDECRARGQVVHHEGRSLWQLTADGRAAHAASLASLVRGVDDDRYDEFLALDMRLGDLCRRWQVRDGVPNDHSEPDHDRAAVAALRQFHLDAGPLVRSLAAALAWTARYPARLGAAISRLEGGDWRAFTGVSCESYQDVWSELHDDLAVSLGRRGRDAGAAR